MEPEGPQSWQQLFPYVYLRLLPTHTDDRGSLTEMLRIDEFPKSPEKPSQLDNPLSPHMAYYPLSPRMAYLSWTHEGQVRGPHEHKEQFDYFVFAGPGVFELYLWDNRRPPGHKDYDGIYVIVGDPEVLEAKPAAVIVPPGIVHGYKCVKGPGLVINMPTRLYKGWKQKEEVDEIRHEDDPDSPFKIPGLAIQVLDEQKLRDFIDNPPPGKPEPE